MYPMLGVVLAWGVGMTVLLYANHATASTGGAHLEWLHKGILETGALWVLGLALAICVLRTVMTRRPSLLWLTGVVTLFFCREIHFAGTSTAVYVGILTLCVIALWRPAWTEDLLTSRWIVTLFMMAFACYLFAVSLDGRWWFDWSPQWIDASVLAEEVLELTGHGLILALVLLAPRGHPAQSAAPQPTENI